MIKNFRLKDKKYKNRDQRINFSQVQVKDVLDSLNIWYTESGKNVSQGWIGTTCPFCDDVSNHMGISLDTSIVSCFKCGKKGNILTFLTEKLSSKHLAIEAIKPFSSSRIISDIRIEGFTPSVSKVEFPKGTKNTIMKYHKEYLESRGFDYEILEDLYKIKYVGPLGKWKNRIIIPVIRHGRVVTFTSVYIDDKAPNKYMHLPNELSLVPIKHYFLGMNHSNKRSIVVVEGLFDFFRVGPGSVPSWGVGLTDNQLKILAEYDRVFFAYDGDSAGMEGARIAADKLKPFSDTNIIHLPPGKDPDKLDKDDLKEIRSLIKYKTIVPV